jgi:hypothetical protein
MTTSPGCANKAITETAEEDKIAFPYIRNRPSIIDASSIIHRVPAAPPVKRFSCSLRNHTGSVN